MDTVSTESSASNEALKDYSRSKVKLNGDMNGSVNAIDVDADINEGGDYKKEGKESSLSKEKFKDENSKINNGGENSSDTEGEHTCGEIVSKSKKVKSRKNSSSHKVNFEPMEVDGATVNSEVINLANSDEGESITSNHCKRKKNSDAETQEDADGDKGGKDTKRSAAKSSKDSPEESDSHQSSSQVKVIPSKTEKGNGGGGSSSDGGEDADKNKENGDCKSDVKKSESGQSNEENASADGNENSETPKKNKEPQVVITPRRSSRTVQRPVRFGHEAPSNSSEEDGGNESDDIEEITPSDPPTDTLADIRKIPRKIGNTTIVVKDTKRLADIAARNTGTNKKEPTLVIIDTNSILSGRGSVPVAQTPASQIQIPSVTVTPQPHVQANVRPPMPQPTHHVKSYPELSAAMPTQGLYPPKPIQRPPPILPMLTDDMYVVEAPSFIVPYVYEKPPVKKFKKYVRKMLKQIRIQEEEMAKQQQQQQEAAKEKEKEEGKAAEGGGDKDKSESGEGSGDKKESENTLSDESKAAEVKKAEEKDVKDGEKVEKSEEGKKADGDKEMKEEEKRKAEPQSDIIVDEVKLSDGRRKDDVLTVKEISIVKRIKGKENKRDGRSSSSEDEEDDEDEEKKKPATGGSYFDNPLGKFFMQIGMNLVQQFVQTDLLKQHKKKQKMGKGTEDTQQAINSLKKNLQMSKENNEPYAMEQNKCEYCSFKTESKLIMAHHLETPHMRNYVYRCNFCPLEVRGPHDILFHMEAEHNIRGRLERAPAFHQCPQCPFEDNQKGKLTRHLLTCAKKFRPEKNLEPPMDWEPPAKIPRMTRKPPNMPMNVNNTLYQQALASKNLQQTLLPKMVTPINNQQNALMRGRGRPNFPPLNPAPNAKIMMDKRPMQTAPPRGNMVYRPGSNTGSQQMIVPTSYQLTGNQIFQVMGQQGQMMNVPPNPPAMQRLGLTPNQSSSVTNNSPINQNPAAVKLLNQPSISITPLPRQSTNNQPSTSSGVTVQRQAGAVGGSNTTFVICEICDGYVKHLEQLRNHMQWIHKVKIHPKMICNRPPLNCQKCQFRFFTDQGLERHLLGSHGLVTSSMQESANEGKDGGRCPVCGRAYQWKLLNHVARDHNMTLKPAHLSYKCTVCTATFGMYKQFENHVYSAHSVVAKRVMDRRNGQSSNSASTSSCLLKNNRPDAAAQVKPFKISDEITIIPQRASKPQTSRPVPGTSRVNIQVTKSRAQPHSKSLNDSVQVIDLEDSPMKSSSSGSGENGGVESLSAVKERLRRRKSLEIRQVESEPDHSEGESEEYEATSRSKGNSGNEEEEEEEEEEAVHDEERGGKGRRRDEGDDEGEEEEDEEDEGVGEGRQKGRGEGDESEG